MMAEKTVELKAGRKADKLDNLKVATKVGLMAARMVAGTAVLMAEMTVESMALTKAAL